MAATDVSQKVIDAALSRMSNASTGFNPTWAAAAPLRGIPANLIVFDFTINSQNFILAQMNPDLLEQSGISVYPFGCMYILESAQTGAQKFNKFSGVVRLVIEIFLSWITIKGNRIDFEKYCNCVESVLIDVFNRESNQNWGKPLVYNGGIRCRRGPLMFGGDNWRQRIGCSLDFEVHE